MTVKVEVKAIDNSNGNCYIDSLIPICLTCSRIELLIEAKEYVNRQTKAPQLLPSSWTG